MYIKDDLAIHFSSNSLVSLPKNLWRLGWVRLHCHSSAAGRISRTIRSIWNKCEAPLNYAEGLPPLCCGYFEIFGKLGYKSHPIILSTLDSRSKEAKLRTGSVEKSLLNCFVFVLPLLAELEEMTECSCVVHRVGHSVLSDKVVTVK